MKLLIRMLFSLTLAFNFANGSECAFFPPINPLKIKDEMTKLATEMLKLTQNLGKIYSIIGPSPNLTFLSKGITPAEEEILKEAFETGSIEVIRRRSKQSNLSDRELALFFYNEQVNRIYELEASFLRSAALYELSESGASTSFIGTELLSRIVNAYRVTHEDIIDKYSWENTAARIKSFRFLSSDRILGIVEALETRGIQKKIGVLIQHGFTEYEAYSITQFGKEEVSDRGCCKGSCLSCPRNVGLRMINKRRSKP